MKTSGTATQFWIIITKKKKKKKTIPLTRSLNLLAAVHTLVEEIMKWDVDGCSVMPPDEGAIEEKCIIMDLMNWLRQ